MNSEELELSLKSEFEDYLKNILTKMRGETEEFHKRVEADLENHRKQVDQAFRSFSERFEAAPAFDEAFNGSVGEHLRLARDEGAKLAANAMAEAEELQRQQVEEPPAPKYDKLREATDDISSKDSQSAILKALVQGAAEFAPRGAFFIIKSEKLVGWKVFGTDAVTDAQARDIHFSSSANSTLGKAVKSLSTIEDDGSHSENSLFAEPLGFGNASGGVAIPLVARGRGVAVLYVDQGETGEINRDALEMLVRVAGLTVELLAATTSAREENKQMASADFENARHESSITPAVQTFAPEPPQEMPTPSTGYSFNETAPDHGSNVSDYPISDAVVVDESPERSLFNPAPEFNYNNYQADPYPVEEPTFERQPEIESPQEYSEPERTTDYSFRDGGRSEEVSPFAPPATENRFPSFQEPVIEDPQPFFERESAQQPAFDPAPAQSESPNGAAMVFDSTEASPFSNSPFQEIQQPIQAPPVSSMNKAVEPMGQQAAVTTMPRTRLSDRAVDLPIDVPEEERRIHNDARRFARLLVSEIKLYNEKKVMEGRQAHDLYERLQEAIDRSREMYDKRVQPPVAARFDYFHYELLNSLAEGNLERLGQSYPGASV